MQPRTAVEDRDRAVWSDAAVPRMAPRRRALPYAAFFMLTIGMLLTASNIVVGRYARDGIPPVTLALLRWSVALAILLPFTTRTLWRKRALLRENWSTLALLGVLGVTLITAGMYGGLTMTDATSAALVNATMPIWIIVFGTLLFRDPLGWRRAAGLVLSIVGVLMVLTKGDLSSLAALRMNLGDVMVFGAILSYGLYSALLRKAPQGFSGLTLLAVLASVGVISLLGPSFVEWNSGKSWSWSTSNVLVVLYLGVAPSIFAYLCWIEGIRRVGSTVAALFVNLLPVFAALLGWLFLGELIEAYEWMAFVFIVIGLCIALGNPPVKVS